LTQLIAGRTEVELGRTDTRRDLTFVADTVEGFVRATTRPGLDGETIQLGTGLAVSIRELFDLAVQATGTVAAIKTDSRRLRPDPSEVLVLQSSPDRARELLGWEPTVSLDEGIARTVDWLRANMAAYRPHELHV
jgi:UDP-glucose 4-epimerase